MRAFYIAYALLVVGTCFGQDLTVIKSKRVYVYHEEHKVKRGQILRNELVYGGSGAKITLKDQSGFSFTYYPSKITNRVRIDSVYHYFKNSQPISDSLNAIIECEFEEVIGRYDEYTYRSKINTKSGHVQSSSEKIVISWNPLQIGNGLLFRGSYYIVIKDLNEFTIKLLDTAATEWNLDILELLNHRILTYEIRTLKPCAKSKTYSIVINKDG